MRRSCRARKCCKMKIYSQNAAWIQPRTSPPKFGRIPPPPPPPGWVDRPKKYRSGSSPTTYLTYRIFASNEALKSHKEQVHIQALRVSDFRQTILESAALVSYVPLTPSRRERKHSCLLDPRGRLKKEKKEARVRLAVRGKV